MSFIALTIHRLVQSYYADKIGATTELSLWTLKRRAKLRKKESSLPLGAIIPLLISILSSGELFFAATTSTIISVKPAYRLGRKFTKLTEFECAKAAVIVPLVHILIAIILNFSGIPVIKDFALVNTMMAISYMLPLPGLLGYTLFFSSKPLYVFSASFILASALLIKILSGRYTLILAILIEIISLITYFWQFYKK